MSSRYKRVGKTGQLEHRKVMEEYIGRKLLPTEQIHHINKNRFDNRIENLQIVTQEEHDLIHKWKYPKTKICVICGKEYEPYESKRKNGKVCSKECKVELDKIHAVKRKKPINQYAKSGELVRTWDSARDIQNKTGYFESNINKCCKGKIKSYKGFIWKYV